MLVHFIYRHIHKHGDCRVGFATVVGCQLNSRDPMVDKNQLSWIGCCNTYPPIVLFILPESRYTAVAERLPPGHRMWNVHGNLVSNFHRNDLFTSVRVSFQHFTQEYPEKKCKLFWKKANFGRIFGKSECFEHFVNGRWTVYKDRL